MNDTQSQSPRRRIAATSRRHRGAALLAAASLLLVASACGDDDTETPATTVAAAAPSTSEAAPETTAAPATTEAVSETTAAPETTMAVSEESSDAAYCAAAEQINSLDGAPTLEQFRAYAELAPAGVADTVADVLAAYEGVDGELGALVGDDVFLEWLDEIDSVETGYCGFESEEEATTSKPDDPYCQIALELSNQGDFPTEEQLQTYADVAPGDIAEPVAVLLAAFKAADGDFNALFGDPEFVEAIDTLKTFEFEYCGIGEESTTDTQLDPNATRVDLVASDYEFDFDVPTDAGRYSFVMQNEGAEPHIMILLKLEDGAALDTVLESEGEEGVAVDLESDLAVPGGEAIITVDLDAGEWVLLCPIPNADQTPHFVLGMIQEITIT